MRSPTEFLSQASGTQSGGGAWVELSLPLVSWKSRHTLVGVEKDFFLKARVFGIGPPVFILQPAGSQLVAA